MSVFTTSSKRGVRIRLTGNDANVFVNSLMATAEPVASAPTIMRRPRETHCAGCDSVKAESDILLHHCQPCADALAGMYAPASCVGTTEAQGVTFHVAED